MKNSKILDSTEVSNTSKNLFESFAQPTPYKEAGSSINSDNIDHVKEVIDTKPLNETIDLINKSEEPIEATDTVINEIKEDKKTLFSFKKEKPIEEKKEDTTTNTPPSQEDKNKRMRVTADIYLGALESVQAITLKKAITHRYKKKVGGEIAMTQALDLMEDYAENGAPTNLSVEERTNLRLAKKMMKKIDDLPFSEDELEKMRQPLITLIEQNPNYDLPPSAVFLMAITQVMLPRTLDAFFD